MTTGHKTLFFPRGLLATPAVSAAAAFFGVHIFVVIFPSFLLTQKFDCSWRADGNWPCCFLSFSLLDQTAAVLVVFDM